MTLTRAVALARLTLAFARVERVTFHEDGVRPETDADHTVMLGLIACDFAPEGLDRGLVAQFALVHDLVEAYAGDVQTLTLDEAGRTAKGEREAVALERIAQECGEASWLVSMVKLYEEQKLPEARFVRVMDKVLPKLTHMLNACVAAKPLTDRDGFIAAHEGQMRALRAQYPDDYLRAVFDLLAEAMHASEYAWKVTT